MYCPHCDPVSSDPSHRTDRYEAFLGHLLPPLPYTLQKWGAYFVSFTIRSLLFVGILKEKNVSGYESRIPNRSLVIAREAEKRGLSFSILTFFRKPTNLFSLTVHGKKLIFESLPSATLEHIDPIRLDDKNIIKEILKKHNLPHPAGAVFRNMEKATEYVQQLGFPVVVKPQSGSLSKHTTCTIADTHELEEAIRIAQMISPTFIVEQHVPGNMYRATLVNNHLIACALREAPSITGDGKHTAIELITHKNNHPHRGEKGQKNTTLHKVEITEKTRHLFREQGITEKSTVPAGKKIYLHHKIILAAGADITDATDDVHPENKKIFETLSQIIGSPLIGIDIMCQDISVPYTKQPFAILEANSLPYIDMHHYPSEGEAINVAGVLLDHITRTI